MLSAYILITGQYHYKNTKPDPQVVADDCFPWYNLNTDSIVNS